MRFIHVGVGGFGNHWVRVLRRSRKADVVAMVDINPAALRQACDIGGYGPDICFPSLARALDSVEADAIVSSTPPAFHRHDVTTAMKAGLHAISEKPMADTMAACKALLKTAAATGRVYAVSQNYRYLPPMWTLAKAVHDHRLGAVGQVKVDFFLGNDFGGGFRHEMPYPLIIDMAIHHFDLVRFLTGLNAVKASGASWNPPWSNYRGDASSTVLFEMNNGARVIYSASWCSKGVFDDWNASWQIECEKGTVTYRRGEIRVYRTPKLYKVIKTEILPITPPPLQNQDYVLDDFIRAVETGRQPRTSVADNIHSIAMVFAAVKAMQTGRKVDVLDRPTRERLKAFPCPAA